VRDQRFLGRGGRRTARTEWIKRRNLRGCRGNNPFSWRGGGQGAKRRKDGKGKNDGGYFLSGRRKKDGTERRSGAEFFSHQNGGTEMKGKKGEVSGVHRLAGTVNVRASQSCGRRLKAKLVCSAETVIQV